jgi:hypothetical protein
MWRGYAQSLRAHTAAASLYREKGLTDRRQHELEEAEKDRLALEPFIFKIEGGKRALVMVSRSEDGIFTSKVLSLFGIDCAFGSSTLGGREA